MSANLHQKYDNSNVNQLTHSLSSSPHETSLSDCRKKTVHINLNRPQPINIETYSKFRAKMNKAEETNKKRLLNTEFQEDSKHSDAVSVNQMESEVKIGSSGISNYFQISLNKIHLSRLNRYIHELKELNFSLLNTQKQQEQQFLQEKQKWSAQAIALLLKLQKDQQRRLTPYHNKLALLQSEIKIKNQEIIQLNQTIDTLQLRKQLNQEKISRDTFCSNCSLLEIKLSSIKDEALQMGKKQAKLQDECQKLQQKIFDLEQQVVGIELEVEKRLKEALQSLPQINLYNKTNQQIIDSVNRQNESLRNKLQRYQKLFRSEQSLRLKQQQLNLAEREYQLKNQALLDAITRNQVNTQLSYEREHQLLLAQENLEKKIEQLRQKETELSEWENTLTKKQSSPKNAYNLANLQTFGRQKLPLPQEEHPSNRSFGYQMNSDQFTNYGGNNQEKIERRIRFEQNKEEAYIPMLPINEPYERQISKNKHEGYNRESKKVGGTLQRQNTKPYQKAVTESSYAYRPLYQNQALKTSASNQHLHVPSQRLNAQSIQGSRIKSIGNRSLSKQSQSPARPLNNLRIYENPANSSNFRGLESKLQRLRAELRKEIESIE